VGASGPARGLRWSQRSFRRILIDTHIPDWDSTFLSRLSPQSVIAAVVESGAEAAMVYFQSHVGLCNWPTVSGAMHGAFTNGDFMGELVEGLHARAIPVCAYYSVHFNNWAYLTHPDWRFQHATRNGMGPLPVARYGLCCSNNPGYRAFVLTQTREILAGYDVDAMFFDMMWQPGVCGCAHCRARFESETGEEFPERIDWLDARWCAFQAARERWTTDWAETLRAAVRGHDARIDVYHNFAMGIANWSRAQSFESAAAHDFLGGDFYGGRDEQLVVSKLMLNLTQNRPAEFMTTVTRDLTEHETLKSQEELDIAALAATAHGAAFLAIVAVDPDGVINPASIARTRAAFEKSALYERELGGAPIEDVAVYFSSSSKMDFADNGALLDDLATSGSTDYPHFHAVRGACRALQERHILFGVITRRQIEDLDRYRVIVAPNVLRMDAAECAAFRSFVARGGRLYASRMTSMTDVEGNRHGDFALADVFGVHFLEQETGGTIYIEPNAERVARAIAPQRRLAHPLDDCGRTGAVRLGAHAPADALASLCLPYGHPHPGSVSDHNWSSIHASPPGVVLETPTIVRATFGAGRSIYSAADIEAGAELSRALFGALIEDLLDGVSARVELTGPACVWMTAFEQTEPDRLVVSLLNRQLETPVLPIEAIRLTIRAPMGRRIDAVRLAAGGESLPHERSADGVSVTLARLEAFAMVIVDYGQESEG